jgi:hypothetical protein
LGLVDFQLARCVRPECVGGRSISMSAEGLGAGPRELGVC